MGLRPTYMDETHLASMSFDGVGHHPTAILTRRVGGVPERSAGSTL